MIQHRSIRTAAVFCLTVVLLTGCSKGQNAAPGVIITSLPAFGTSDNIAGMVSGVNPAACRVAVFIEVPPYGWYSKPTCAQALTGIQPDGSWSTDRATT